MLSDYLFRARFRGFSEGDFFIRPRGSDKPFPAVLLGSNGSVQKCGNVDDCKKEIIDLLEGGKEAFEQRMTRYKYRNAK